MDNQGYLVVESKKRFLDSCIWKLQQQYFSTLPHSASALKRVVLSEASNGYVAKSRMSERGVSNSVRCTPA